MYYVLLLTACTDDSESFTTQYVLVWWRVIYLRIVVQWTLAYLPLIYMTAQIFVVF